MELVKEVGELFMVGFHGFTVDAEITRLIKEYGIGSIVLFQRNVSDAKQLHKLTADLQRIARDADHERPLFIAIDQEGGLVTRIKPPILAQMPGAMTLGASALPDAAFAVSTATGEALRRLGINMNLAPIGDVNSEPKNPVIGVRSPGDNPNRVGDISSAVAKALAAQQICPVIKHFPGHGDTAVDSHYGLPLIQKSMAEFEQCELVPFQRSIADGIDSVMTAHISVPALDVTGLPASLSPKATELLRSKLLFEGLLMSDCLEMDGVRATFGTVKAAEMAFAAGTDCLMVCHTYDIQRQAIENIAKKVESGELSRDRLVEASQRMAALKGKYVSWDQIPVQEPSLSTMYTCHVGVARRVYDSAVTLVRDADGILPLDPSASIVFLHPGEKIVAGGAVESGEVRTRTPYTPSCFADVLRAVGSEVEDICYDESYTPSHHDLNRFAASKAVLLVTRNATQAQYQHDLGLLLSQKTTNLIVAATCDPYDFLAEEKIGTYLATYEPTVEAFESAVKIIFGQLKPTGNLPVRCKN